VIELRYGGVIKVWKFEWGSLYLWKAVRESPFGRHEYSYITVYIRKGVADAKRWVQKTVYVGRDVAALARRLVATAPRLSWSEALKKAREAVRALLNQVEAAVSGLKAAKREFRQALSRGPDAAEEAFDKVMEGVEFTLDNMRQALKDLLAELPDE